MVLTGINTILRFLYVLSKKYQLWQEKSKPVLELFLETRDRGTLQNRSLVYN